MDKQENSQNDDKQENTQQKEKEKLGVVEQVGQNLAENLPKILGLATLTAVPVLLAMVAINKISGG